MLQKWASERKMEEILSVSQDKLERLGTYSALGFPSHQGDEISTENLKKHSSSKSVGATFQ